MWLSGLEGGQVMHGGGGGSKQQKLTQSVLEFQNTREAERCVIVESKRHSDLIVIKACS